MNRGIVADVDAIERLCWRTSAEDRWLEDAGVGEVCPGLSQVIVNGFLYLIGSQSLPDSKLLVIARKDGGAFFDGSMDQRQEAFARILKVALSRIDSGVKVPVDWRMFHAGSLISFQSNKFSSQVRSRIYMDVNPEGESHLYAFGLIDNSREPLSRTGYDSELFIEAILGYGEARSLTQSNSDRPNGGQVSVALTQTFTSGQVTLGVPFSVWRDSKLTSDQLSFFNAPFDGPLRLRGAAGTGKTLVLCLRFLREIYARIDDGKEFRAAFLTHGQETSDQIRAYLTHMDERGVLPALGAKGLVEVTTLHGLANEFISYDGDEILPISLDGSEGRKMQMELVESLVESQLLNAGGSPRGNQQSVFSNFLGFGRGSPERLSLLWDLIDEFSSVLEAYGVRDVDQIAERYLKAGTGFKTIAKSPEDRQLILEFYRSYRDELSDMGVVSLDQFIADFSSYLNSFRWDSVRNRKGFDFVFADELHLFNKVERQLLGFLLRDAGDFKRVAVAYDPRQSPRSSFLPEDGRIKDSVWIESHLSGGDKRFELTDVFRYSPEILSFLKALNGYFPADDLSEEWGLVFGESMMPSGDRPLAIQFDSQAVMATHSADRARRLSRSVGAGRVAVLALDQDRFQIYQKAGMFRSGFVHVTSRDDVGRINRFNSRAILSIPEYVAGLQFEHVILLDANASLLAALGYGVSGLQRFISTVYLGASRARKVLELYCDRTQGGFAAPIRNIIGAGVVEEK